jgi:hypothetical protein
LFRAEIGRTKGQETIVSRKPPSINGSHLSPAIEAQIDANLRRVFEEDANGEIPERLRALIEQLHDPAMGSPPDTPDAPCPSGTAGAPRPEPVALRVGRAAPAVHRAHRGQA